MTTCLDSFFFLQATIEVVEIVEAAADDIFGSTEVAAHNVVEVEVATIGATMAA